MNICLTEQNIPGTVLPKAKYDGVIGIEFLDKIFYVTDGIMLSQVREISGVDGTTLQNWVKRGWLANTVNKMYTKEQLARILIINMLRDAMQLSTISFLLEYINGDVDSAEDDIISESQLYDYICRTFDEIDEISLENNSLRVLIETILASYEERKRGARARLVAALEIIATAHISALVKQHGDRLVTKLKKA